MVKVVTELGEITSPSFCKILGKLTGLVVREDWSAVSPVLNAFTRELTLPACAVEYACEIAASVLVNGSLPKEASQEPLELQLSKELFNSYKSAAA